MLSICQPNLAGQQDASHLKGGGPKLLIATEQIVTFVLEGTDTAEVAGALLFIVRSSDSFANQAYTK
jgi:hypothetical protein